MFRSIFCGSSVREKLLTFLENGELDKLEDFLKNDNRHINDYYETTTPQFVEGGIGSGGYGSAAYRKDKTKETLLSRACEMEDVAAVELLIKYGAKVNKPAIYIQLERVAMSGYVDLFFHKRRDPKEKTPMTIALDENCLKVAQVLKKHHANMSRVDKSKYADLEQKEKASKDHHSFSRS